MKKFTSYSIGRNLGKMIAALVLSLFISAAVTSYVTGDMADNATGTEQTALQNTSDMLALITLAMVFVPAIHSMRLTVGLGFMKQRVYVPEINMWLSHAGKALFDFVTQGGAGSETIQEFMAGKLKIEQFAASIKCIITSGTGNVEIFSPSVSTYRQGRIPETLNNAILPKGTNIAISHIALAYATDASATVPEGDVDYSRVVTAWPAALANGETIFKQSGAIKQRFENKFAGCQANGTGPGVESDGLEFETPFVLEEDKGIIIEQRYAAAQAISGSNNHFLDICMLGAILRRKS